MLEDQVKVLVGNVIEKGIAPNYEKTRTKSIITKHRVSMEIGAMMSIERIVGIRLAM